MNTQEYISSGIVESYVLGLASAEERIGFEQACAQYPEVLQARIDFELALEKQALENAVPPPAELKGKIMDVIGVTGQTSFMPAAPVRKLNWLKYAAAACLLLLAGSIYLNISLSNKNKKLQNDYNTTAAELNSVRKDIQTLTSNPQVKMASLKGTDISPQSYTTVYWDTTTHDVFLLVNNLPKPASGKQYQVWALLNNQPIDLGLIDNDYFVKQNRLLIKAKNVQQAEAFAITLEDTGGNPTPKGKIYVVGKP